MKRLYFSFITLFIAIAILNAQEIFKNKTEFEVVTLQNPPAEPIARIISVISKDEQTQNVEIEFYAEGATNYSILHEEIGEPFIFTQSIIAQAGYNRYVVTDVNKKSQHIFKVNASNEYGVSSTTINYNPIQNTDDFIFYGEYPNGETVKANDIFLLNDRCNFLIRDKSGLNVQFQMCNWSFQGLNSNSEYISLYEKPSANSFEFKLDTTIVNYKLFEPLGKHTLLNDSSVYYVAKIKFIGTTVDNKFVNLEIPVYLNLLPGRPTIEVLDKHVVSWETGTSYINLKFKSDRANNYRVVVKEYDEFSTISNSNLLCSLQEAESYKVEFLYPFDEKGYLTANPLPENKFGFTVTSNMVAINNTIIASVKDAISSDIQIYPNPVKGILFLKGDLERVVSLLFIDVTGRIIKKIIDFKNTSIDLSGMSPGVYTLIVEHKNQIENKSIKLIKY